MALALLLYGVVGTLQALSGFPPLLNSLFLLFATFGKSLAEIAWIRCSSAAGADGVSADRARVSNSFWEGISKLCSVINLTQGLIDVLLGSESHSKLFA